MLAARICRAGVSPGLTSFVRRPVVSTTPQLSKGQIARLFVNDGRSSYTRTARRRATAAERAMAPAGETGKPNNFTLNIFMCVCVRLVQNNLVAIVNNKVFLNKQC